MKQYLIEFLKNEDGILGALFGSALGGLIGGGTGKALATAVGGALGKSYDDRKAIGKDRAYSRGELTRMVADAKAAGLNPYSVLESGYQEAPTMQFGSLTARANAHDAFQDIITGREARKTQLEELAIEQAKNNLNEQRRGSVGTRPTFGTNNAGFGHSDFNSDEVLNAEDASINPEHDGDLRAIQSDPEKDSPITQQVTTPGELSYRILNPELFEVGLGELISGAAIHGVGAGLAYGEHVVTGLGHAQRNAQQNATPEQIQQVWDNIDKNHPDATKEEKQQIFKAVTGR